MKIDKFYVVKLKDNNKAIILTKDKRNRYLAEIIDKKGMTVDKRIITKDEINRVIYSKKEKMK
mgnify:FL=1